MGTPLTKDEEQVLKLAAVGRTVKELATETGISADLVRTHLQSALASCPSRGRLTHPYPRPRPPLSLSRMSSPRMRSVGKLRGRNEPARDLPKHDEGRPRIHVVDSRQELLDSLSEDELREVIVELAAEKARQQNTGSSPTMIRRVLQTLGVTGQDSLRAAVDMVLGEMPDVDLADVVRRVRFNQKWWLPKRLR